MHYSSRIMVSPPPSRGRRRAARIRGARAALWSQVTRGFITGNRRIAFLASVLVLAIAVAAVHVSVWWFSPGVMILPILAGGLLLWPRALHIFFFFVAAGLVYDLVYGRGRGGALGAPTPGRAP